MNILIVTPNSLNDLSGGSLSLRKILAILDKLEVVERIGLIQKESKSISKFNYKKLSTIHNLKKSFITNLRSRMLGEASFINIYSSFIVDVASNYNVIIVQGSRLGSVIKKLKESFANRKIIVQFENFEYEFAQSYLKRNLFLQMIKPVELYNIKRSERYTLKYGDVLLFLTQKDKDNVLGFYNQIPTAHKIIRILPHAQEEKISYTELDHILNERINFIKENRTIRILFTGSFEYYPNVKSAEFLIKIIKELNSERRSNYRIKLLLAGKNAKILLKELANDDVEIYSDPDDNEIRKIFLKSTVYASAVFEGSGMKTKIAEALSYGLPILASEHSLIGYDYIVNNREKINSIAIFKDYDKLSFKIGFYKLLSRIKNDYDKLSREAYQIFKAHYSVDAVKDVIKEVLES